MLSAYSLWLQGCGPKPSIPADVANSNSVLALDYLWALDTVGKAEPGSMEVFIQAGGTGETLMILSALINSTHPTPVGIPSEGTEVSTINTMPVVIELAVF